jgi:hypothetical protein
MCEGDTCRDPKRLGNDSELRELRVIAHGAHKRRAHTLVSAGPAGGRHMREGRHKEGSSRMVVTLAHWHASGEDRALNTHTQHRADHAAHSCYGESVCMHVCER